MIKWRHTWTQVVYIAMTVVALAVASGAGWKWG